jgi:transcriptional regulator with PAS, ATPase and Fis domain
VINCGAIHKDLILSELFGHEKGAFTGAIERKIGLFELAHNGDIFLDEIAELPLECQVKLLRVLDGYGFMRAGGTQVLYSNFRLICATNRNLEALVREGKFREDVYHRICVCEIQVPPLRDRKEDIPLLCKTLLSKITKKLHVPFKECSREVIEYFKEQEWKGNVRALKNVLENMAMNTDATVVQLKDIPVVRMERETNGFSHDYEHEYYKNVGRIGFIEAKESGLSKVIDRIEKEILREALNASKSYSKAADEINISKVNLCYKMKKYNLYEN